MITQSGHFLHNCDCGCKFILMPYHQKQRGIYSWHRPVWDMCHQCFRKWEKKTTDERINHGIEGLRRDFEKQVKQAQEKAADLTFKAWGMRT